MGPNELEAWLARVLVPVEPSERFAQRLKARLVTLRRAGPAHGWVAVGLVVAVVVLAVSWMGLALRIAVGILALLGFVQSRQKRRAR
jgi:broad specificity phosphatase PhoE